MAGTRDMTAAALAEIIKDTGAEFVVLILLDLYDTGLAVSQTIRLHSGTEDLVIDVGDGAGAQTWEAVGGAVRADAIPEATDLRTARTRITLSAVDRTIVTAMLSYDHVGRDMHLYIAPVSGGAAVADPIGPWAFMIDEWSTPERRSRDEASAEIEIEGICPLSVVDRTSGVQTNVSSHQNAKVAWKDDTFFQTVPDNTRKMEPWGARAVAVARE